METGVAGLAPDAGGHRPVLPLVSSAAFARRRPPRCASAPRRLPEVWRPRPHTPWSTSCGTCPPAWRSWPSWPPARCGCSKWPEAEAATAEGRRAQYATTESRKIEPSPLPLSARRFRMADCRRRVDVPGRLDDRRSHWPGGGPNVLGRLLAAPAAPRRPTPFGRSKTRWPRRRRNGGTSPGLENVLRWQPTHARAHLAMAECAAAACSRPCSRRAENPMSLAHIRDAAMQSRFSSRAALVEWLSRAVGSHWDYLERGPAVTFAPRLALCPIEGRAYVYLADLSFLAGADAAANRPTSSRPCGCGLSTAACSTPPPTEALLAGDRARWLGLLEAGLPVAVPPATASVGAIWWPAGPTKICRPLWTTSCGDFSPTCKPRDLLYGLAPNAARRSNWPPWCDYRAERAEIEAPTLARPAGGRWLWLEAQQIHGQTRRRRRPRCAAPARPCTAIRATTTFTIKSRCVC